MAAANSRGSRGSPCWTPFAAPYYQSAALPVARRSRTHQGEAGLRSQEHLLAANAVKGVLEVKLDENFARGSRMSLKPATNGMDSHSRHSSPKLGREEMFSSSTSSVAHETFASRRRRISPTAISLMPPLGFGTATRPAPASTGATSAQA